MKYYEMEYKGNFAGGIDYFDCGCIKAVYHDDISIYPTKAIEIIEKGEMKIGQEIKINDDWLIKREE